MFRDKVRAQRGRVVTERAADDLFHFPFMKIKARSEHEIIVEGRGLSVECFSSGHHFATGNGKALRVRSDRYLFKRKKLNTLVALTVTLKFGPTI